MTQGHKVLTVPCHVNGQQHVLSKAYFDLFGDILQGRDQVGQVYNVVLRSEGNLVSKWNGGSVLFWSRLVVDLALH